MCMFQEINKQLGTCNDQVFESKKIKFTCYNSFSDITRSKNIMLNLYKTLKMSC